MDIKRKWSDLGNQKDVSGKKSIQKVPELTLHKVYG